MSEDDTILTWPSRSRIDFTDPDPAAIRIEDVAHSLAREMRYAAHVERDYSVAAHSLFVVSLLEQGPLPLEGFLPAVGGTLRPPSGPLALTALLHDATEAYLRDVPGPAKRLLPDYRRLEAVLWPAVAARFRLTVRLDDPWVKHADQVAQAVEQKCLRDVPLKARGIEHCGDLLDEVLFVCSSRKKAEAAFLRKFALLAYPVHDAREKR